jgi:hypothetical protein
MMAHLILYAVLDDKFDYFDRSFLAQSVDPVHGLVLDRRVPPGVHHEYHGRFGEVECDPTGLEGDQEDGDMGVVH